jgi:ubiquinone biosynthesis monooxygenase Coq7
VPATDQLRRAISYADRVLKVDHAGENGAVNIYRAQIFFARWRAPRMAHELIAVLADEKRHRSLLGERLQVRRVRRCRSYHLCGLGGLALGLVTGLLGASAIAATTVAVEQVVLSHMHEQMNSLMNDDLDAYSAIAAIIEDEQAHHDNAIKPASAGRFWPRILSPIVRLGTECVIWLGMRI